MKNSTLATLMLLLIGARLIKCQGDSPVRLYISSYNEANEVGITNFDRQNANDQFQQTVTLVTRNPSYLCMDSSQQYIYATNELHGNTTEEFGKITAYEITDHETGQLKILNYLDALGYSPAYVSLDATGKFILSANYGSGRVVVMRLSEDGSLDRIVDVVEPPPGCEPNKTHAHMVAHIPNQPTVVGVVFLGLDGVYFYNFDNVNGRLSPIMVENNQEHLHAQLNTGVGPRHYVFSHDERFLYVVGENSSTVTVFESIYDEISNTLVDFKSLMEVSALPKDFSGTSKGSEIALHTSGQFLYTSNRGYDSIAVFEVDQETGLIGDPIQIVATGGRTPRHFALSPEGLQLIVANQNSNSVVLFDINTENGTLENNYVITDNIQMPIFVLYQELSCTP